jgi:hypothetical protein
MPLYKLFTRMLLCTSMVLRKSFPHEAEGVPALASTTRLVGFGGPSPAQNEPR